MKKLKPILLAAAALGGLALMAAAALLDLPGGITGLMCGMGGALLGLGGSSVIMGAVERDALDPSLLRRNGPPLRLLYGQYGPLGQKAVRRKNHAHKNDRTGP